MTQARLREVTLVVPCYNEAKRLDADAFLNLARDGALSIVFVDDGSTDTTRDVLSALCARGEGFSLLSLTKNSGKAEAVRQGMLRALADRATIVGYVDADLSTPPREIVRLLQFLRATPQLQVVMGARILRLGAAIERDVWRHYLGRVFASVASLVLAQRVYDTQCGAKLFRISPSLCDALSESFHSPWAFDVELLGRLFWGSASVAALSREAFLEVPLEQWRDVAGSKLRFGSMVRSGVQLLSIQRALRKRKRAGIA